jgi:hypothetical protein
MNEVMEKACLIKKTKLSKNVMSILIDLLSFISPVCKNIKKHSKFALYSCWIGFNI